VVPEEIEESENEDIVKKFDIYNERGTQHILVNQKLQGSIVDEYTKEAVEN